MADSSLFQKYLEMGFGLIPVHEPGSVDPKTLESIEKIPYIKWGNYKDKKPEESEMLSWFATYARADFAVLTGFDNLVLCDIDDPNIYDRYLAGTFKNMVARTPSGGIGLFVKSSVVPKSFAGLSGLPVDIRGLNGYSVLPSQDLTPEEIAREEQEELEGKKGKDKGNPWIRRWLSFESPEEVTDIVATLKKLLPEIKKPKENIPVNGIDWVQNHNTWNIVRRGHGYIQVRCPIEGHVDNNASFTIYEDGFICYGCGAKGNIIKLLSLATGQSEEQVLQQYPGAARVGTTFKDKLIELVSEKTNLLKDYNENTFYYVKELDTEFGISQNIFPINSDIAQYWINRTAEKKLGKKVPDIDLKYVTKWMNGEAKAKAARVNIWRRIGGDSSNIYYDMGDNTYTKITANSLEILPESDIVFVREAIQDAQAPPSSYKKEDILKIFDYINIEGEEKKLLVLTWILTCFLPNAQYPILLLCGTRGSGKTEAAKKIKRIIDPVSGGKFGPETLVYAPNDLDKLTHQLSHTALAVLDNISHINLNTGNLLCQAVTSGHTQTRLLYTTNESLYISIRTRIILTSINREIFNVESLDASERTVCIELDRPDGKYIDIDFLDETFELEKSKFLGSAFALLKGYLRDGKPKTGERSDFRMTVFASMGKYLAKELNFKCDFNKVYARNQGILSQGSIDAEPLSQFIFYFSRKYGSSDFSGNKGWGISKNRIFDKCFTSWIEKRHGDFGNKELPRNANILFSKLRKMKPDLKKLYGIELKFSSHRNTDWVMISKPTDGALEEEEISEAIIVGDFNSEEEVDKALGQTDLEDEWS